jgi:hypothetical protein
VLRLLVELEPVADLSPNRPARLVARLEGGDVVCLSHQPLADSARRLLALGIPADQLLTLRHAGKPFDSFVPAPISWWARWTYEESDRDGLRRRRWMPRQLQEAGQKSTSAGRSAQEPILRRIRFQRRTGIKGHDHGHDRH